MPDNTLKLINKTKYKRGAINFSYFLPRHCVNQWKKEVDRALLLHPTHAEYITYKMPFRGEMAEFVDKIYTPFPGPQPAGDMAAYTSG